MKRKEWDIDEILMEMINKDASDLHIDHGRTLAYRLDGKLIKESDHIITGTELYKMLTGAEVIKSLQQSNYHNEKTLDFAYKLSNGTRFRGNLSFSLGNHSAVFRRIPNRIFTTAELGVPQIIEELTSYRTGMILMTGPTGSGKTTTLASVLDYMNDRYEYKIETIEEPVEYIHKDKKSVFTQREVPQDAVSFS